MYHMFLYLILNIQVPVTQLPVITKSSPTILVQLCHSQLNDINFIGCQCMNSIKSHLLVYNYKIKPLVYYSSHIQFLFYNYLTEIYCCIDLDIILSQVFFFHELPAWETRQQLPTLFSQL